MSVSADPSVSRSSGDGSEYDRWSRWYDLLGDVYSAGGIDRAKLAHVDLVEAGERVLYLGAGSGREAILAATRGARVTLVDSSEKMLARARVAAREGGVELEFLRADARSLHLSSRFTSSRFDMVVAPFFLNVFGRAEVTALLRTFSGYARSGGRFVTVDFRAPSRSLVFRALQHAYYLPPLALFWAATNNAWHELYDYVALAEESGAPLRLTQRSSESAWGLPLLETLVWEVA